MFLHSGASLHGHEYSNRPNPTNPQNAQKRHPLIRSAFATSTPIARSNTFAESTKPALRSRRTLSEHKPRALEQVVRFQEPEPEPQSEPEPDAYAPPTPMSEDEASYSASELSDASQTTDTKSSTTPRRRRRRAPRKAATYMLAVPPPRLGPKAVLFQQIRPKLLLQLQLLPAESRPRPVIDVYPSSMIGSTVVALFAKKFPRIVGKRGKLALDDIVLLKSEEYDLAADDADNDGDGQNLGRRALVAVLSPLKHQDRAEVVLDDGSILVATPLANGNFDFVHEDCHGNITTARWARRTVTRLPSSPAKEATNPMPPSPSASPLSVPEYRYTFSIINPLTRRHPVMASLTPPATLEIQDHYTTVSSSYGRYPPSRDFSRAVSTAPTPGSQTPVAPPTSPTSLPLRSALSDDEGDSLVGVPSPGPERSTIPIDDALKNMISVTAIWVALRSGWSPHYKAPSLDAAMKPEPSANGSAYANSTLTNPYPSIRRSTFNRSVSVGNDTVENGVPVRRESPDPSNYSGSTLTQPAPVANTAPSSPDNPLILYPQADAHDQRGPSPDASLPVPCTPGPARPPGPAAGRSIPPRRATSTGAAFMQRRRQQQQQQQIVHASDASDSERPLGATVPRRKKFPRVLSGDWGAAAARYERMPSQDVSQEPAPPGTVLDTPPAALQQSRVAGSIAGGPETPPPRKKTPFGLGRRNSSAGGAGPTNATPGLATAAAATAMAGAAAGGRRAHSAYYAASPIKLGSGGAVGVATSSTAAPETERVLEMGDLPTPGPGPGHGLGTGLGAEDDEAARRAGAGGRFRSIGNWFRRLGGH